MKKTLIIIITIIPQLIFAQLGCVSSNNKYLAAFMPDDGIYKIFVYNLHNGSLFKKIPTEVNSFDTLQFLPSNNKILLTSNFTYYVYDLYNSNLIKKYYSAVSQAFSANGNIWVVASNGYVISYNFSKNQETFYSLPENELPLKVAVSPNGQFLAAITNHNWAYIWRLNHNQWIKSFRASELKFSGNSLLCLWKQKADIQFKIFSLPKKITDSLYTIQKFRAKNLLETQHLSLANLNVTKSSFSPDAKLIALYVNSHGLNKILIFSAQNQKFITTISSSLPADQLYPYYWLGDSIIVWQTPDLNGFKQNILTGKKTRLYLRMLNPTNTPKLYPSEQLKKRIFSPDFRFVVMPVYEGAQKFLLIKDALINSRQISYKDANFVAFSPQGNFIYLSIENLIFELRTQDLPSAMLHGTVAKLYQLGTSFKIKKISNPTLANHPPKGYKYLFTKRIKPITQIDSQKLYVLFRGMHINPNYVELMLNLVDDHGDLITGATNPQWLYIWCNLLVLHKPLNVQQTNFTVKEINETQPTAYALVLDHSGSMGDQRADTLQFAAWNFIRSSPPSDAFMLIKFDNHVKIIVHLTKNKYPFLKPLSNQGLKGFGGSTALNDAAYTAVLNLAPAKYPKKIVLLFTDGYENASKHSLEQVINLALKYHVEIFTIGFGKKIDQNYLKTLAYLTGGAFYHIYTTSQIKNIFKDVDLKRRHYYTLKFSTQQPGKYLALLQMCQNFHHHDSIIISYNTDLKLPPLKRIPQINPKLTPKQKQAFIKKEIPKCPPKQPVTNKKILKEFYSIHFPNIYFAFNSAKIIKSEQQGLIEIAQFMKRHPNIYLRIEGHTDSIGSYQYNIWLSKRRAEAAKRLLVSYGIAPGRIFTVGYGFTRPLASNKTPKGRAKNRRIEFKIFVYKH